MTGVQPCALPISHAIELAREDIENNDSLGLVLHDDNWHPGVIGIVASRLVEKFYRPTIMLTTIDGVAKGSARSIVGFNIYEALQECKNLLVQFGGHKAAAGLEIKVDKIDEFRKRFNEILRETLTAQDVKPEVIIDQKISLHDITPKFVRILNQFAPFGPGNMRPVFLAENVNVKSMPRIVGTNHMVVSFSQNGTDRIYDSIGFNMGVFVNLIEKDKNKVDIVFTIEKIVRDGRTYPQLRLKDLRIKE